MKYIEAIVIAYGTGDWIHTIEVQILGMDATTGKVEHVEIFCLHTNQTTGVCWFPEINDIIIMSFLDESCQRAICWGHTLRKDSQLLHNRKEDNTIKQLITHSGFHLINNEVQGEECLSFLHEKGFYLAFDIVSETITLGHHETALKIELNLKDAQLLLSSINDWKAVCGDASITMSKDGGIHFKGTAFSFEGDSFSVNTKQKIALEAASIIAEAKSTATLNSTSIKFAAKADFAIEGGAIQLK